MRAAHEEKNQMETPNETPNAAPVPRLREAYERLLPEALAVPDTDLLPINLEVATAVTTVLGAWPQIRTFRGSVALLPGFDLARFDKIEDYALALGHAQSRHNVAGTSAESLPDLSAAGTALRQLLLTDAASLAQRGLVDADRLDELKGPNGYRNLAFDLDSLATLLRESWEKIAGKTPIVLSELDEAETLADRLLTAVGIRDQAPPSVAETAAIRQRAYTLCLKAYDQARRAIGYLRWQENDLEQIAPSLFTARAAGRRKNATQSETAEPAEPPPDPAPESAEPAHPPVPPGLPGASPFVA
jgi:hypothetical protein